MASYHTFYWTGWTELVFNWFLYPFQPLTGILTVNCVPCFQRETLGFQVFALLTLTVAAAVVLINTIHLHIPIEPSNFNHKYVNDLSERGHHVKRSPKLFLLKYEGSWLKKLALFGRTPKLLAPYAAGWSKKLKVASKLTPFPPLKKFYAFSSVFDKGVAKLFKKVPFGRKKRSPRVPQQPPQDSPTGPGVLSRSRRSPIVWPIFAAWSKKLKVGSILSPVPLARKYFKVSSVFDKAMTKLFLKVPLVGRKKRSPRVPQQPPQNSPTGIKKICDT